MKTSVLVAILISTAIIAHAQKKINEGSVTYKIEYALTPDQSSAAKMLPAEQKVKFNGSFLKIDMQRGPATITVIRDFVSKAGTLLIDVPVAQMQMAVKQTKEELEKDKATAPKFSDFKATGEKKMFGAYNGEKYTYKDDKGGTYELWATTDVELPAVLSGDDFKDVKGTLLKFTKIQDGIKSTLTVKDIKEEKVGPISLQIPSGYELKTMEEVMSMGGGE